MKVLKVSGPERLANRIYALVCKLFSEYQAKGSLSESGPNIKSSAGYHSLQLPLTAGEMNKERQL